jgi:hypothetical protein
MADTHATSPESDPFLAMIDTRLAALQHLRASYLAARVAGAVGQSGDIRPPVAPTAPWPVPAADSTPPPVAHARRGMVSSAVERLLAEWPHPLKPRAIATALRRDGVTSAKLGASINSALHRLKHLGRVVRTDAGWTVNRAGETSAPSIPPVVRVPPHRPRRARRPRPASAEPKPDQRPDGLAWRIESFLKSHGKPVAARYVAEATGEPINVVGLALGRMVRQQRVEKQDDGHFAVVVALPEETTNGAAHS